MNSGKGRNTCKHFEELDAILGTRPASSPVPVIDSGTRKHNADSSSSGEESSDEGHEIEQPLSDEQSDVKGDQNADLGNDATDPLTNEVVRETTLTGIKKQKETPKASETNDPKDGKEEESKVKKDSKGKKAKKK